MRASYNVLVFLKIKLEVPNHPNNYLLPDITFLRVSELLVSRYIIMLK